MRVSLNSEMAYHMFTILAERDTNNTTCAIGSNYGPVATILQTLIFNDMIIYCEKYK